MKLIERFERKYPKFGIPNLILHIIIVTAAVMVADLIGIGMSSYLALSTPLVLSGQIWRLATFIFVGTGGSNPLFAILILMFVYFTGRQLEAVWGTCRFTLYYAISMLCTIAASFILPGVYDGYYINLSLFIAFAAYYPDYQIMYMMIIPLKAKYLMWIDLAFLGITVIQAIAARQWALVLSIASSLLAPLLFFGGDMVGGAKSFVRRMKYKRKFK
jgi:membrane associated rhomboid family serine protease